MSFSQFFYVNNTYLHVTHGDTVVPAIPNNFILNLLPTLHTLLNQYLRTSSKCLATQLGQLLHILGETRTQTTESIGSSNNDGETNSVGGFDSLGQVDRGGRLGALLANLLHSTGKHLSVFSGDDGLNGGTEYLDTEFGKLVLEFDTDVQGGLTTESTVDTIRLLVLDDLEHKFRSDRKEVNLVRETLGSLDSGNVGVDEDGVDTFLLQSLDGLGTGVVEFTGLSNGKTTGTKDKNLLDLLSGFGSNVGRKLTTGNINGDQSSLSSTVDNALDEDIEKELSVSRTRSRLGVELNGEEGFAALTAPDTLVRAVVGIGEQRFPAVLKGGYVDFVTVILRGDVASTRCSAGTRNVHTTVTVLHLAGLGTGSKGEKLVTKTDTEDRDLRSLEGSRKIADSLLDHGRVTRTVRDEETIVRLRLIVNIVVLLIG